MHPVRIGINLYLKLSLFIKKKNRLLVCSWKKAVSLPWYTMSTWCMAMVTRTRRLWDVESVCFNKKKVYLHVVYHTKIGVEERNWLYTDGNGEGSKKFFWLVGGQKKFDAENLQLPSPHHKVLSEHSLMLWFWNISRWVVTNDLILKIIFKLVGHFSTFTYIVCFYLTLVVLISAVILPF